MFVARLLPEATDRLVTVTDDAPLIEAARLLQPGRDIVVVCNGAGALAGVVTKTDVVTRISECQGAGCIAAVTLAMTEDVVACRPEDELRDVWGMMKARELKNLPVLDNNAHPIGILTAGNALQALLEEMENEEELLREYVMCVGYR